MRSRRRPGARARARALSTSLTLAAALAACEASKSGAAPGSDPPAATLASIEVAPAGVNAVVGAKVQFTATGRYSDASSRDLTASAAWTSASGAVAAFQDAAQKGLLTALAAGNTAVAAAQDGKTGFGSVSVTPAPPAGVAFPLRVAPGGRYLEDQAGKPFRVHGEAAWSLVANLTAAEAETYLENRRLKGVNALIVNLIEHQYSANAPNNRANAPPFNTPGDLSTPNDAYFDFAVALVGKARAKGQAVLLTPAYLGYAGGAEGWFSVMSANDAAQCLAYGQYVGQKFKDLANVIWVEGGDYTPPAGSAGETCALQVMAGIRQSSATLHTGHWDPNTTSLVEPAFAASMQLNAVYRYLVPHELCRSAYGVTPALPAFLFETGYENETVLGSTPPVRKYQYWGQLGCIGGQVFGNLPIWRFDTGWPAALESPGSLDAVRLGQLFDALAWQQLVPSGLGGVKTLVTAGGGTAGGQDYVAAAASPDGRLLVAYVPPTGTGTRAFSIDLSALTGSVTARWFNPTTGAFTSIGSFAATGTHQFTTPGDNGTGTNDWVLVLNGG